MTKACILQNDTGFFYARARVKMKILGLEHEILKLYKSLFCKGLENLIVIWVLNKVQIAPLASV